MYMTLIKFLPAGKCHINYLYKTICGEIIIISADKVKSTIIK